MPLFSYGINHKSANIAIREQLVFEQTKTPLVLRDLLAENAANEAVILSTCNRTEIYATTNHPQYLRQWFLEQCQQPADLAPYCYAYQDLDCVKHLMRVASGLDSMVLGEPQIFGQIKKAYQLACEAGSVSSELQQIFPAIFSASKQIRLESNIGAHSVSLAYAIVQLSKKIFSNFNKSSILLIGAGAQMELIATHLASQGAKHFLIANRSLEKAQRVGNIIRGKAIQLTDIPTYLPHADIVITATASPLPLIGKGSVESAIKLRKHRPIFMVDLAVPRDIEPEVAQLEDIYLYNLDDLEEIINANLHNRNTAALHAETLIAKQSEQIMRKLRIQHASELIQRFRLQANSYREHEIRKALRSLDQGQEPAAIIDRLARNLTNKFLHQPTIKLRQAASEQQQNILDLTKELLEIES